MIDLAIHRQDPPQKTAGLWLQFFIGAIGIGILLAGLPAQAAESQAPWECSSYTGDAHIRCVETFAEWQRDQIAALQGKLQAQQEMINTLKAQAERQTSANADLQRQLTRLPTVAQAVPSFYSYPPVGLSLNFGSAGIYGSPYYYSPFAYGPPFFGLRYRSYYGW